MTKKVVSFDEIIAAFGPKIGLRIMKKFGGLVICQPATRLRELRDRKLYHDYTLGLPYYESCAKYHVTKEQYHRILGRMRKKFRNQRLADQPTLRVEQEESDEE